MQNDLNLTPLLREHFTDRPRIIGRYHASELYYLLHGLTTPEQWLNPKSKPLPLVMAMWNGTLVHQYIQDLLPSECNEIRVEYEYTIPGTNDVITLVGKIDHVPNHIQQVWEFKTSKNELPEAKAEHAHQCKLYCTMIGRPEGVVYQPVQHTTGLYLKHLETVLRDDAWFEEQMQKLVLFHQQVVELSYAPSWV